MNESDLGKAARLAKETVVAGAAPRAKPIAFPAVAAAARYASMSLEELMRALAERRWH